MKIVILSLLGSLNRLKVRNYNYEYFDAIDNHLVLSDLKFNSAFFNHTYGRLPTNGEIGCTLSHMSIYRDNADDEWLCILEDDALEMSDFKLKLNELSSWKTDNPTVVLLGHSKISKKYLIVHKLRNPLFNKIKIGSTLVGSTNANYCGTVGYVINKSARAILAKKDNIYWKADDWGYIRESGIKVLEVSNPIIYEDLSSESSTGNKVHCSNNIFRHPIGNLKAIIRSWLLFIFKKR